MKRRKKKKEKSAEDNYAEYKERQEKEQEAKTLQERIEKSKERRKLQTKLSGKTLGEESDDDDAASWVKKQKEREKERERQKAEKKERERLELEKIATKDYKANDLTGLRIGHDLDDLVEGQETILTLKDSTILENEEEGDELENLKIIEKKKLQENLENKKKKPVYTGVDDEEFGADGPKKRSLLSQYDEPEHRKKIVIGDSGFIPVEQETLEDERKEGNAVSLSIDKMQEIRDFYTEQEMVKFKKVKSTKKRKSRSAVSNILDELSSEADQDHGSRSGRRKARKQAEDETLEIEDPMDLKEGSEKEDEEENEKIYIPTQENFVDDDDLQEALKRTRKIAQKAKKSHVSAEMAIAEAARELRQREEEEEREREKEGAGGGLVISATTEFIRDLDETALPEPQPKPVREKEPKNEDEDEVMADYAKERSPSVMSDDQDHHNGNGREKSQEPFSRETSAPIEDEPLVGRGLAATLALLQSKGFLEKTSQEQKDQEKRQVQKEKWTQEQKKKDLERELKYEKEKDKDKGMRSRKEREERERADRERDRDRDYAKKFDGYQPAINLQYTDKFGRELDPKEAFRLLSHRFHGKGPGKKNTERELKRIEAEMRLKHVGGTDSVLQSVDKLEQRQKALGQAGIVIQVGNKQVLPPSISISDASQKNEGKKRKSEPEKSSSEPKKSKN